MEDHQVGGTNVRYIYGPNGEEVKNVSAPKVTVISVILLTAPVLVPLGLLYALVGKIGTIELIKLTVYGLLVGVGLTYIYAENQNGKLHAKTYIDHRLADMTISPGNGTIHVAVPSAKIYGYGTVSMNVDALWNVGATSGYVWTYNVIGSPDDPHHAELPATVRFTPEEAVLPAMDLGNYILAIVPPSSWYYLRLEKPISVTWEQDRAEATQIGSAIEIRYVKQKSQGVRLEGIYDTGTVKLWETDAIPFIQKVFTPGDVAELTMIIFPHKRPLAEYGLAQHSLLWEKATGKSMYVTDIHSVRMVLSMATHEDVKAEVPAEFVAARGDDK